MQFTKFGWEPDSQVKGADKIVDMGVLARLWAMGYPIIVRMRSYHAGLVFAPELVRVQGPEVVLRHWGGDFVVQWDSPLLEFYSVQPAVVERWTTLPKRDPEPSSGWIRTRFTSVWTGGLRGVELFAIASGNGSDTWAWTAFDGFKYYGTAGQCWTEVDSREIAERQALEWYNLQGTR